LARSVFLGKAPDLQAEVALVLPVWTNRQPIGAWRSTEHGAERFFKSARAALSRRPADTAQSHFSYSNMVWRLPDLVVSVAREGKVCKSHWQRSHAQFIGTLPARSICKPFGGARRKCQGFSNCSIYPAAFTEGEIWGHWRHP